MEEGHIYIPPSCLQKTNFYYFFKYVTLIIFCYFYIYFFWQYDATLWAPYTFLFYLFNQPYKIPLLGITLPALKFLLLMFIVRYWKLKNVSCTNSQFLSISQITAIYINFIFFLWIYWTNFKASLKNVIVKKINNDQ